jgi:Plasmid pRiA4b ORF-3-like protein
MAKLSEMLLAAMGWTNSHVHAFRVGEKRYGMNFDEYPDGEIDEKTVTVLQALRDERRFTYDYDFGDGWEHEVVIEELSWSYFGLKFAVCIDGQNACPPEDIGGTGGYVEFLEAISDPTHEEHESYLEWVGGSFDPAEFDLANANALLQKVR